MLCEDLEGWDGEEGGPRERIYIYIFTADSHHCKAETSTTL